MGWKASSIIIKSKSDLDYDSFTAELGYLGIQNIQNETFETAIYPDENKLFIGRYKDCIIISAQDIPMLFFEDSLSKVEQKLIERFPDAEICSIVLHSVVNLWGFAIIKNGAKIRVRAGSANDGTFCDYGELQEEEKEIFSKSSVDENGRRIYKFEDMPGEIFSEDQVGENYVFAMTKRYFSQQLDSLDDLLFETEFNGYEYSENKYSNSNEDSSERKKPWWKFW
ncbi:DUF6928 family protein [Carboxylicivirga marina]|uniref:DUF6928 family protein n=1 Tax=Carboxylicivirga marina TaxID=2800988 RepID=UPI002598C315|nr:hypothetical protein [uncultured Carboxylicivirga sp.]